MRKLTKLDLLLGESFETLGENEQEEIFEEMLEKNQNSLVQAAKEYEAYHDDPPCHAKLNKDGFCPECKLYPDMQSVVLKKKLI